MASERMKIEGEVSKRYRVSYGGNPIGSYDTAKEALAEYENYEKTVRPVTDPKKKFRYSIHDGRVKEITLDDLRRAAAAEK
jgi:hypothetical protein